ncbi:adenylyl-sulfate kinase [Leptolyngbya sp. BL0902]|uniref:bifunctional aminoglycoside phosphotransferase/ATP-binding protein n=1 Tax=Leptolyngbya sp. BL0902 TaxID=1115757 RepID=UPI0018E80B2B|nr:bifunctional aminoglycoside phosphotransferase/ATP-binding protein [Leptolyngbya sp. BL0902]QQE63603.1 adenylyl-sulfate kinase [Leptolyngbya sp. BL0902]
MTDTALPALIQQMCQPSFYPHPVVEPIRLMQTHVSYVLLTGDYAYKVKKPVNFGFLDYSTLERRRHFCEEELRLNQRTAADLYLEVVPIGQSGETYHLGADSAGNSADDAAVEYAVKMVQFPQDTLLSACYERGELTEDLILTLADQVAAFHQGAETNDHILSFGTVAQIRQAFDENYAQTQGYVGGPQTQAQLEQTQAATDHIFATQADLFQQRIDQRWIRACHGDLHLNNLCHWNNQLYLFDCIEFNEPFRYVDVMYDVGFVVMDLLAKGCRPLATAFLNHYVEQTGDWEGLQLLPLYISRQAYVRAKVTSFLLNDPAVDAATKAKASDTAAAYYRLAWEVVQPQTGRLYLMAGLSGAGKSTTAREVARQTGAIHLRSDAVRKHLAGVPLQERGDQSLYSPEMTQKTYARLLNLGLTLAKAGFTVILDAKYDRQSLRQPALDQAQQAGLSAQILHCTAPAEILEDRVRQRSGDIADATVAVLQQQVMEPFTEAEQPWVQTLDTMGDVSAQIAAIVGA